MPGSGDSEVAVATTSLSVDAYAGADADAEADELSRQRLPKIGMPDIEPARRVVLQRFAVPAAGSGETKCAHASAQYQGPGNLCAQASLLLVRT